MKVRITFLSLLAVSTAMVASAQVVEYDDMYFTAKDRAKAEASKPLALKSISTQHEVATAINPTDSYSARNVNPEYISQSTVNPSGGSSTPVPYSRLIIPLRQSIKTLAVILLQAGIIVIAPWEATTLIME